MPSLIPTPTISYCGSSSVLAGGHIWHISCDISAASLNSNTISFLGGFIFGDLFIFYFSHYPHGLALQIRVPLPWEALLVPSRVSFRPLENLQILVRPQNRESSGLLMILPFIFPVFHSGFIQPRLWVETFSTDGQIPVFFFPSKHVFRSIFSTCSFFPYKFQQLSCISFMADNFKLYESS